MEAWAEAPVEFQVEVGLGPSLSLPYALEGTVRTFFGPMDEQSAFRFNVSELIGPSGQVGGAGNLSIGVVLRAKHVLRHSSPYVLGWDVGVYRGVVSTELPDGAAPFTDPIAIDLTYLAVVPRIYGQFEKTSARDLTFGFRSGLGRELMQVETSITSALLDVQDSRFVSTSFFFLEQYYRPVRHNRYEVSWGLAYDGNEGIAFDFDVGFEF